MVVNWNTDEAYMKRNDPEGYKIWRIAQMINYGLWGEKLDKREVLKYWDKIKDAIDIDAKKTLEFFLWGKKWKGEPGLLPDRSNYFMWLHAKMISGGDST